MSRPILGTIQPPGVDVCSRR